MKLTPFCLILSAAMLVLSSGRLSVRPDRSCFFRYEHITFSCSENGKAGGCGVKRNTSSRYFESCEVGWGTVNGTSCTIKGAYTSHSGQYWCETDHSHGYDSVAITVTSDTVILSVPAHPVPQGAPVSLQCLYQERRKESPTTDFEATFFRNGTFIGKHSPGTMTILTQSQEQEGLYRCEHPTKGSSREVLLRVSESTSSSTSPTQATPPAPHWPIRITVPRLLCFILLFVLYTVILFIALAAYRKWAQARAEEKQQASERVSLRGIRSP